MSEIAKKVGAYFLVDMAHIAGLVAAGLHQNPVEFADVVTSTTHKTLRGPRGGIILCKESLAKDINKAVFPELRWSVDAMLLLQRRLLLRKHCRRI